MDKEHKDPETIDLEAPRHAQYMHKAWNKHQSTVYCVAVALAESGLVTGLATKSCPPVPPPQLRLSRVARALHAASAGSQPSADVSGPSAPSAPASEASCAAESASNSDDEWDALLDAHGLTSSFGGTAAAVAQPADAAGASRRARDKRRRRQRKAAKRSMWRDI